MWGPMLCSWETGLCRKSCASATCAVRHLYRSAQQKIEWSAAACWQMFRRTAWVIRMPAIVRLGARQSMHRRHD